MMAAAGRWRTIRATCTRRRGAVRERVDVWLEKERFREEWSPLPTLVCDPPRWWARWDVDEVVVNDGRDPGFRLQPRLGLFSSDDVPERCSLSVLGRTERAGREAFVVEALPFPDDLAGPPWALAAPGEDERRLHDRYVLEVDVRVGVLLAVTGYRDGQARHSTEVESIEFDRDFPPGTFEYAVPRGLRVVDACAPMCGR